MKNDAPAIKALAADRVLTVQVLIAIHDAQDEYPTTTLDELDLRGDDGDKERLEALVKAKRDEALDRLYSAILAEAREQFRRDEVAEAKRVAETKTAIAAIERELRRLAKIEDDRGEDPTCRPT